jgi:hypothetical protein
MGLTANRRLKRAGLLRSVGYGATLHYVSAGALEQSARSIAQALITPAREPYDRLDG